MTDDQSSAEIRGQGGLHVTATMTTSNTLIVPIQNTKSYRSVTAALHNCILAAGRFALHASLNSIRL